MTQINLTDDCVVRALVNCCLDNAESSQYGTVEKSIHKSVLRQIIKDFMQTEAIMKNRMDLLLIGKDIDFCREYETGETGVKSILKVMYSQL